MAKRNFEKWLSTMKDSIATWTYYTDFKKVYENVQKIKIEINIILRYYLITKGGN